MHIIDSIIYNNIEFSTLVLRWVSQFGGISYVAKINESVLNNVPVKLQKLV